MARVKWGTSLNEEEVAKAQELLDYLWDIKVLEAPTPYAMMKYLIFWGYRGMQQMILQEINEQEETA